MNRPSDPDDGLPDRLPPELAAPRGDTPPSRVTLILPTLAVLILVALALALL